MLYEVITDRLGQHGRRHPAFLHAERHGRQEGRLQRQGQHRAGLRDLPGQLPCHQARNNFV